MTTAAKTSKTRDVFLYFSPLTFLAYLALPHGYLLDIATTYMLKNQLHASVTAIFDVPPDHRNPALIFPSSSD